MKGRSVVVVLASALVFACASSGGHSGGFDPTQDGGSGAGADGGQSSLGADATTSRNCSDPNAGDLVGCSCPAPDEKRACWTIDPSKRDRNGCKDGTQTCSKTGEFAIWGPCLGEITSCPAFWDAAAPACTCYPGAVRWCDSPVSCNWGKQQCMPDGTWGACSETSDRPANCGFDPPFNFPDPSYNEECCVQAGQCCQDFEGPDPTKSKGKCDQIACTGNMAK